MEAPVIESEPPAMQAARDGLQGLNATRSSELTAANVGAECKVPYTVLLCAGATHCILHPLVGTA